MALVPGVLGALAKAGIELAIESGAGEAAGFPDGLYAEKGAVVGRRDEVLSSATLLLSVRSFAGAHDRAAIERLGAQHVLVGFLDPLQQPEAVKTLAARGLTSFALELVPRISRAQSMDALARPRPWSATRRCSWRRTGFAHDADMMTAAGTIAPRRVK